MVSGIDISLKIYNSQFHVDLFINNPVSVDYHVPYGELKYALFRVLVISQVLLCTFCWPGLLHSEYYSKLFIQFASGRPGLDFISWEHLR